MSAHAVIRSPLKSRRVVEADVASNYAATDEADDFSAGEPEELDVDAMCASSWRWQSDNPQGYPPMASEGLTHEPSSPVAGFIGMHTTARLLARGDNVIGVDNFNDYYRSR